MIWPNHSSARPEGNRDLQTYDYHVVSYKYPQYGISINGISPSTDKMLKKMWYMFTVEFYLVIKIKKIILFAKKKKWMELEIAMLCATK